ncbi:hypothetical protein X801_03525 [Opisthorchis viverrini]|uniref:MD-2-related lipid-recognition domain-containing protein n=1 Tax=Opisthorchis viverrini TaxID=6198 RepID=A0A1S8X1K6_OPIVI|nr:hypothetical protein X801_03525 [Opisthorchis viverrini]
MLIQHTILLLTTAFTLVSAETVTYKDCGSKLTVGSVSVQPCKQTPCVLKRGSSSTIRIVFRANETAGLPGDAAVQLVKWGIPFPVGLENPQICGDVKPSCPLQTG